MISLNTRTRKGNLYFKNSIHGTDKTNVLMSIDYVTT